MSVDVARWNVGYLNLKQGFFGFERIGEKIRVFGSLRMVKD
jgi:hypothetical protein